MLEADIQVFAMTMEVYFNRPRPFAKDKIDELATWLTDSDEGFSLRPEQVRVRHTDIVFDYELSATFFGGNVTFKRDAEKTVLTARGARTRQDAVVLQETASRFIKVIAAPERLYVSFSANAHAALASEETRQTFLASFRPNEAVVHAGALGFVKLQDWTEEVRIAIEPSFGLPKSLFFTWHTRFLAADDPLPLLQALVAAGGEAAEVYGVKFNPLN